MSKKNTNTKAVMLNLIQHLELVPKHVRRSKLYFVSSAIALFVACGHSETYVPKQYIQFDTMVQIMADMDVVEAKGNLARSGNMIEDNKVALKTDYEQVFFNYHTSQARFDSTYNYYATNPALLDKLIEKSIEELNRRNMEALKK